MSSAWVISKCGSRYKVDHIPSGCQIAAFASREAACDFIAAIAPLVDWNRPVPASDPRVLDQVRRAAAQERA